MPPGTPGAPVAAVAWTRHTGRGVEIAPLLDGGRLYVATTDRRVQEVDPATGRREWRKRLDGTLAAGPVLDEGRLYAATSQPDGSVYGMDLDRHKVLWKSAVGAPIGPVVLFEGALLVTTEEGRVYGLAPGDGRTIWVTNLGSAVWGTPVFDVTRALLFVPARSGQLFGIDGHGGERRWMVDLKTPLAGVDSDGRIAGVTAVDGGVFAVEAASGKVVWSARPAGRIRGAPVLADSLLLVAGLDGTVSALRRSDGSLAWQDSLGGPFRSPPAVRGDSVVLAAVSGQIWRLDLATGRITGQVRHPEPVLVSPVAVDSSWVVAGERGELVAYRWGS